MPGSILIVEDDHRMRKLIAHYFKSEGYHVLEAEDGRDVLETVTDGQIDLIILDLMMPLVDGWTVCRSLRSNSSVPIIILTARRQEDDQVLGFELGADDYITKPFSPRVLVARARALLNRTRSGPEREPSQELKHLRIDDPCHQLLVDDQPVYLSPREYELLLYFIKNRGQVLSREQILDGVWGFDYFGDFRTVDTHVWRLRAKLTPYDNMITTIRGFGYRFEVDR